MEEQLITFETAKLAKEKGFNEMCYNAYHIYRENLHKSGLGLIELGLEFEPYMGGQNVIIKEYYQSKNYTLAPTQSLLQKWLREIHNIHIKVDDFIDDETGIEWDYEIVEIGTDLNEKGEYIPLIPYSTDDILRKFLNYESALESALQEALKLLNNE